MHAQWAICNPPRNGFPDFKSGFSNISNHDKTVSDPL